MATTFTLESFCWPLQLSVTLGDGAEPDEVVRLVAAARTGDLEAFDKLMQLEQRRVYRTALNLLGRREDAEDAVQEAFLRVHRGLSGYDSRRAWRPWLYAVAINVCRDMRRKRRMRAWVSLDAWRDAGGEDLPTRPRVPTRPPKPRRAGASSARE